MNEPTPYFLSLLTNSCFLPVNRAYLKSQRTNFGKNANNILVNGPFRVSSYEDNSHITYIKNESYYDANHVYLDEVNKIMLPSSTKKATLRKYFEENKLDEAIISSEDKEGWETYISGPEGKGSFDYPYSNEFYVDKKYESSTYFGVFNFNRRYFEYSEEDLKKTEHEKELTNLALMNKSFRQAFVRGLNVTEYLKKYNKEDPTALLYRGFTSRGTDLYACKDYADYVDEEYNRINNLEGEEAITLTGINQGYDPIFDETKSKELFNKAKEELLKAGIKESEFPIKIDIVGSNEIATYNYELAMYSSLENIAKDVIKIQINKDPRGSDMWTGDVYNYDFNLFQGWGPDYPDAESFLHGFCIGGDLVNYLGFSSEEN